ncbi:MAG: thioredoxin [Candidatus Delongbacteria bacterium]|nr:thioredoxin [Candidatus Delongbacteria bacterium]
MTESIPLRLDILPDQPLQVLHLNGDNFSPALEKYPLILLDFWAEWCHPCRMLGPVLEELALEYQGRVVIAKVNIDQDPDLAQSYQVESIPTIMILKQGNPVERWVGFRTKSEIKTLLVPYL